MNPQRKAGDYRHQRITKGHHSDHGFRKGWPKKEARTTRAYRHAIRTVLRAEVNDPDALSNKVDSQTRYRIKKDSYSLPAAIRHRLKRKVQTEYASYTTGYRSAGSNESDLIDKLFSLEKSTSLYAAAVSDYLYQELLLPISPVGLVALMKLRQEFADSLILTERLIVWRNQSSVRFPEVYGPRTHSFR